MSDDKETEIINELRNRMKADMDSNMVEDDTLFYRFLKFLDFDIDAAENMLKKHLKWRKEYDVDTIIKNYKEPEILKRYLPNTKLGYDKEGGIVRYIPIGDTDFKGVFYSCRLDDIKKRMIFLLESDLEDIRKKTGKLERNDGVVTCIYNGKNFSILQATDRRVVSNFLLVMNTYMDNYPLVIKSIIIINASPVFENLHSFTTKMLPSSVLKKIFLFSEDTYKEELLKRIDPETLPAFLGGNRTDPDGNPQCLTFVDHGAPVPEKYYIHKSKRSLANLPDVKKITISNSSFYEAFAIVKEPESYLEWEFEIESWDIGFGLFYRDITGRRTEIFPVQRINTDDYSEKGIYKCDSVGTYILMFDNTYSYIRSKNVYYKLKVLTPREESSLLID